MMRLQVIDNRRKFLSALVVFFLVFALKGWEEVSILEVGVSAGKMSLIGNKEQELPRKSFLLLFHTKSNCDKSKK